MVSVPAASVLSVDRSQPPVAADDADDAEAPSEAVAVAPAEAVADPVADWLELGLVEEPAPEHAATIAASRSKYGSLRERRVRVHLAGAEDASAPWPRG